MKDFVKACLKCNLTTVLSGSSGAGKTTFTEAMTKYLDIRVGVAEDCAWTKSYTKKTLLYLK